MSERSCPEENCTVALTGKCLLDRPVDECPNINAEVDESEPEETADPGAPVLQAPAQISRFLPSAALGVEEARAMMRSGGAKVIGVLGAPNSGKTAALVSLYLLVSHAKLAGFSFANSRSLMAFEDLARGTRDWNQGAHPDQMTSHTEMDAGRSAGFLHIKLRRDADERCFDLLIPDLPGEWSSSLIDNNRHERLSFLASARAIWIMVDGASLRADDQRLNAVHRLKRLIARVAAMCEGGPPDLHIVITRHDAGPLHPSVADDIVAAGAKLGVELALHEIASFSDNGAVPAGSGIADLIAQTLDFEPPLTPLWPDAAATGSRQALRFAAEALQ